MRITYSIQVCNESRELYSLINFLTQVIDSEDNIQVIVDSLHVTDKVKLVLDHFKNSITVHERPFDNFQANSNFHIDQATGEYVFAIDADEMPQVSLIKGIKNMIQESGADVIWIPRINIHPGLTPEFLEKCNFNINENMWINWPDYQGRILKNNGKVRFGVEELHTKPVGGEKVVQIHPVPALALWHIKSVEKQNCRWLDGTIQPPGQTLYDALM